MAQPVVLALANEAEAVADRESTNVEIAVTGAVAIGPRGRLTRHPRRRRRAHQYGDLVAGTVSTEDEKEHAGRIAVSASPAGQVRNQLEVRERLWSQRHSDFRNSTRSFFSLPLKPGRNAS